MKSVIRAGIIKTLIVSGFLVGLAVWRHEFAISGFLANPILNGTIIGAFLFAMGLAFRSMLMNRNDGVALAAIQEIFDDTRRQKPLDEAARNEMQARVLKDGIVFKHPVLLGHVFDLTTEEMQRTGRLNITIETMHHLSSAVATRIAEERSLLQYITGLLVFLGLIGTFIGLMEMVGSVGGIIGGLAGGDSSSGDAMKKLLHDLEAPLVGMATGFSASLFGLFGSLVLGLVGRFSNAVAHHVLEEMETWLAGISQLDNKLADAPSEQAQGSAPAGLHPVQGDQLAVVASAIVSSFERCNLEFGRAISQLKLHEQAREEDRTLLRQGYEAVTKLPPILDDIRLHLSGSEAPARALGALRGDFNAAIGRVEKMYGEAITRSAAGIDQIVATHEQLRDSVAGFASQAEQRHDDMAKRQEQLGNHLYARLGAIDGRVNNLNELEERRFTQLREEAGQHVRATVHVIDAVKKAHEAQVNELSSNITNNLGVLHRQADAGFSAAAQRDAQLSGRIDQALSGDLATAHALLRQDIGLEIGRIRSLYQDMLSKAESEWSERVAHVARNFSGHTDVLIRELRQSANQDALRIAEALRSTFREGFNDVSRSIDGAFMHYTAFARDALAHKQTAPDVAITPPAAAPPVTSAPPETPLEAHSSMNIAEQTQLLRRALQSAREAYPYTPPPQPDDQLRRVNED